MDNYFSFYGLDTKLLLDENALRQQYLELSKKHHPDFFVNDDAAHADALEKTSLNNRAYKALSSLEGRVQHLLELNGMLEESGNKIPQEFLMEMMTLNEAIMELQMGFDETIYQEICKEHRQSSTQLNQEFTTAAESHDQNPGPETLETLKEILLKKRYLKRIEESLGKLGTQ